ncbi:MAG: divalent-cation tolerance protein CutA [Gammaproteobacteria bacterium]|nr:divalent-cation tolerance protein CutA [Gammaproteobacteria bacterium]
MTEAWIVLCTCPEEAADRLARTVVEQKLAACVNITTARSVYRWRGQIETAAESLLIMKVACTHYEDLEQRLRAIHPYELPEILAIPVERGLPAYLAWLADPDAAEPSP